MAKWIIPFSEIHIEDVGMVGGKNASLGEMFRELKAQGVRVPDGFAVTAEAFREYFRETGLDKEIRGILKGLDTQNAESLQQCGRAAREAILKQEIPAGIKAEILKAYANLSGGIAGGIDVAVRSSATAEDLPNASFAGQQETFLNVHGETQLMDTCRRCFASLFTDRAISYRQDQGFDHFQPVSILQPQIDDGIGGGIGLGDGALHRAGDLVGVLLGAGRCQRAHLQGDDEIGGAVHDKGPSRRFSKVRAGRRIAGGSASGDQEPSLGRGSDRLSPGHHRDGRPPDRQQPVCRCGSIAV